MTTVNDILKSFLKLAEEGHGNAKVFGVCGSSGASYEVGSARVTDHVDPEGGPFDLEPGEQYASLYLGN
jgi:hypothetical protein